MPPKAKPTKDNSSANLGFEAKLWLTADSRSEAETAEGNRSNNMDAAETSGASKTAAGSPQGGRGGAHQYKAENVFWVPADARWSHLQASAKQPTIGKTVDDAMVAIERDNPRPGLDTVRRDSALSPRAATPQSQSAAKDNQRSPRRRLRVRHPQAGGQLLQILQQLKSEGG